jgi:hypothetical protein
MWKSFGVLGVAWVLAGAASPSAAVVLGFTGQLEIAIRRGTLPPVVMLGGSAALVNGSGPAGHLSAFANAGGTFATVVTVPVANVSPISGVIVSAVNGAGSFAVSGGVGGGTMPINGSAKLCLFNAGPGCTSALSNLIVPLSVAGVGGSVVADAAVSITVTGAPWTTGTVGFGTLTAMGFVHGPASLTSSTANVSGAVRLVTPIAISTSFASPQLIPAFASLTLHFLYVVPEPGTLLLFGSGVAGLAAIGRARMRQQSARDRGPGSS